MNAGQVPEVSIKSYYCSELDSATAATLALPVVGTLPDDDSVFAGNATCATSTDTASGTTHRPDKYLASSGISRVH
jgi:hypothetical protein